MRDYLSKQARETLLVARIAADKLDELANTNTLTPDEKSRFRQARTHIIKGSDAVLKRIGLKAGEQLLKMLRSGGLYWLERSEGEQAERGVTHYKFTTAERDNALELLMERCMRCKGETDCALRVLLDRVEAPEYDADHPVCQYSGGVV